MEMSFGSRLVHAWNAFLNKDPTSHYSAGLGANYSYRPDRPRLTRGNERSIVTSVYNRIAMDAAQITIRHCKLDDNGRYISDVNSKLNNCFNLEANIDQTGRAFIHDAVMSMLDEGCVAIVPIDTTLDPKTTGSKACEPVKSWIGTLNMLEFVSIMIELETKKILFCLKVW